jgi:hypothetical protein
MGDNFRALETYLEGQTEIEREAYRKFRARLAKKKANHGGQEQSDFDNETARSEDMGPDRLPEEST